MSHVSKVDVRIRDLGALGRAAERCGCYLDKEARRHRYWLGKYAPCTAGAIRIAATDVSAGVAYEIGVSAAGDGDGYELAFDSFLGGRGLMERVSSTQTDQGQDLGRLLQWYAAEVAMHEAELAGWQANIETLPDGTIEVHAFC